MYYVTSVKGFQFITEAHLRDKDVAPVVRTHIDTLAKLFFTNPAAAAFQPGDVDFVVDPWGSEWGYYIVDHLHRSVFWLHANDVQWIAETAHGLRSHSDLSEWCALMVME